jgi:hypothetical protein
VIVLKCKIEGVPEAVADMRRTVDREVARALTLAALDVAEDAKANHSFTNRTGKLERSIKAHNARGTFSRGTLYAEVSADTYYAQFVEEKVTYKSWAYLAPAWRRMHRRAEAHLSDALTRAATSLRG